MSRMILEVDAEALRQKLGTVPEELVGPFRAALAEYDALLARGVDPIMYEDGDALVVASRHSFPAQGSQ